MDRDASLLPSGAPQCQVLGRSLVSSLVKRGDVVDVVLFHPLIPCQALGQAFDPLSLDGRGDSVGWIGLLALHPSPLDCGLGPQ